MRKYTISIVSIIFLMSTGLYVGCSDDSSGPEEKPVKETVVVGTQVSSNFLDTGKFDVLGTPLDDSQKSILSDAVKAEVSFDSASTNGSSKQARISSRIINHTSALQISAKVISHVVNKPGTDPFAISMDIDGSGSMASNDPNRTRVSGAQDFVDKFSQGSAKDYDISVFAFEGDNNPDFDYSELLSPFTDNTSDLKNAIDLVKSNSGNTPTYESLLEVLDYSEQERPTASNERAIVLLSDGYPSSTDKRDEVCQKAKNMHSPIYSIGLGPASDVSTYPDPRAIQEMRRISSCSGGSYAGIAPMNSSASASKLYQNIAVATSKGNIKFSVQLSGPDFNTLQPGTILYFTLNISTAKGGASATFSFSIPQPSGT